mgnify:CR=1 FL=1
MAKAFFVKEFDECPECGSRHIVYDDDAGETVCRSCGFVLGEVEYAPPPERIPKVETRSYHGLTSFAVGTERLTSRQRTESNTAQDIDRIVSRLGLPNSIKLTAVWYMRKLLGWMREQKGEVKVKLTSRELALISVWGALRIVGAPVSMDEYAGKLNGEFPGVDSGDILKLENRASIFARLAYRIPDAAGYITRLTAKLEDEVDYPYLKLAAGYATQLIKKNPWIMKGRKPVLAAAAALLAADDLLARKIGVKRIAEVAGAGTASVSNQATFLKKHAPTMPRESASLRYEEIVGGKIL